MSTTAPALIEVVVQRVAARTGRRVKDLTVEIGNGAVTLRGSASSYHIKQLAQHAAQEALPNTEVENAIVVE